MGDYKDFDSGVCFMKDGTKVFFAHGHVESGVLYLVPEMGISEKRNTWVISMLDVHHLELY